MESILLRYCGRESDEVFKRLYSVLREAAAPHSSRAVQCSKRCFSLLCERLDKVCIYIYIYIYIIMDMLIEYL